MTTIKIKPPRPWRRSRDWWRNWRSRNYPVVELDRSTPANSLFTPSSISERLDAWGQEDPGDER